MIQEWTVPEQWNHVQSKQNPADLVSRGISPEKLQDCHLWFYGPLFLHATESVWPVKPHTWKTDLEKRKTKVSLNVVETSSFIIDNIDHRNNFKFLQILYIAYILRFIRNCQPRKESKNSSNKLCVAELEDALITIVRETQQQTFTDEIVTLKHTSSVKQRSSLFTLSPFLDNNHIIRVGGRLQESTLSYDAKHPMLLPYAHDVTRLIFDHLHKENLHAGPQALLATVRERFWAIRGKKIARAVVKSCVRCATLKPRLIQQIMENLPATRVQPYKHL